MFYYSRPDERGYAASATGSVDADFEAEWLMDGRANFPAKRTGALNIVTTLEGATFANLFAIINHNVAEAVNVTFTHGAGGGTVTPGTWGGDDIPYNPFVLSSGNIAGSTTVASSGNTDPYVIGEAWAGRARQLPQRPGITVDLLHGLQNAYEEPYEWTSQLAPYDDGNSAARVLTGKIVVDADGYDEIRTWYESTRRGTRPTLIIPDHTINDAWLATFSYTMEKDEGFFHVSLTFKEIPRQRW